jgi:hypothetical protein
MLASFGLVRISEWSLSAQYGSVQHLAHLPGISFTLEESAKWKRHVVYVFLFDELARYVGETSAGLAQRLVGYRYGNPSIADTDNRVKLAITEHLQNNGAVSIWIIQPDTEFALGERTVRIPLSKPIEEYLIRELRPDLNVKILAYES